MERKSRFWPGVITAVTLLPLGYVLSVGPAWWLSVKFEAEATNVAFDTIYAPLRWAAARVPEPLQDALDWYVHFWTPYSDGSLR